MSFALILVSWFLKMRISHSFSKILLSKNYRALCHITLLLIDLSVITQLTIAIISQMLLLNSGCIERNPGPENKINFGVWNLDSLLTRDKHKISLIEGLNSLHNFDIFGVVESYLSSGITDDQLGIHGFSPVPFRADAMSEGRSRGGICLYYNENLPITNRTDMTDGLEETIIAEIKLKKKNIFFILSYRSPSKNSIAEVDV